LLFLPPAPAAASPPPAFFAATISRRRSLISLISITFSFMIRMLSCVHTRKRVRVWEAEEPRQQRDSVLEVSLQGGWAHPLAACGMATPHCWKPAPSTAASSRRVVRWPRSAVAAAAAPQLLKRSMPAGSAAHLAMALHVLVQFTLEALHALLQVLALPVVLLLDVGVHLRGCEVIRAVALVQSLHRLLQRLGLLGVPAAAHLVSTGSQKQADAAGWKTRSAVHGAEISLGTSTPFERPAHASMHLRGVLSSIGNASARERAGPITTSPHASPNRIVP
jgi:hypothetical protein